MSEGTRKLWTTPTRLAWKLGVLNWVVDKLIKDGQLETKAHTTKNGRKCTLVEVVDALPIDVSADMVNPKKLAPIQE